MRKRTWGVAAVAAMAVAVYLTPNNVSAAVQEGVKTAPSSAAAEPVAHQVSKVERRAARQYWTPQRMANAKPMEIILEGAAEPGVAPAPDGKPGGVPAVRPNGKKAPSNSATSSNASPTPMGFAYPYPYNRTTPFPTFSYRQNPWKVNGKIFFTQNGGNYVCSGTVVNTPDKNTIYTAGHCVADGAGNWNSSTVFVPAYDGNASNCCPRGTWTASSMVTTGEWFSSADLTKDLAAMIVPSQGGKNVQEIVGAAGFAYNQTRNQQFVAIGYPAGSPFDGTRMIECQAAFGASDGRMSSGAGPLPMGIGCDMTGGSSGGSWQIQWGGPNGNSPGRINGLNSYGWSDMPEAMWSPYFDSSANGIRCFLQTSTGAGC